MSADCKGEKPMSKSAQSLFVFSIYLFTLGLILLIIPNFILSIFSVPETQEVWIRVVGMLVIILGYFDFQASKNEMYNTCLMVRHTQYRLTVLDGTRKNGRSNPGRAKTVII
jgi:hypothetical protein